MAPAMQVISLTQQQWQDFLDGLYERDERLERRQPGQDYPAEERVDAYAFSAHAEALQSGEIDGDLWGTLQDIEASAGSESAAWATICAFYAGRGCVLLRVSDAPELEEWILSEELARRLGLLA